MPEKPDKLQLLRGIIPERVMDQMRRNAKERAELLEEIERLLAQNSELQSQLAFNKHLASVRKVEIERLRAENELQSNLLKFAAPYILRKPDSTDLAWALELMRKGRGFTEEEAAGYQKFIDSHFTDATEQAGGDEE